MEMSRSDGDDESENIPSPLMRLPLELRSMVYFYLFSFESLTIAQCGGLYNFDIHHILPEKLQDIYRPFPEHALMYVSKQIRHEAQPVRRRSPQFLLIAVDQWVRARPKAAIEHFAAATTLYFEFGGDDAYKQLFCINAKEIRVVLHCGDQKFGPLASRLRSTTLDDLCKEAVDADLE
jgi:hypothetical protein